MMKAATPELAVHAAGHPSIANMFDQRLLKVTFAVVLLHVGLVYLLQSGLGRRISEAVIAPEIVARIIPADIPAPPAPEPPKPIKKQEQPKPVKVTPPRPQPKLTPTPLPPAPDLPPVPTAPVVAAAPPTPPAPAPVPETPAPAAPSVPRAVGLGEIQCTRPAPSYPPVARRMGEEGRAVIKIVTDDTGRVIRSTIVESSGSSRLDQAAMDAVRNMRCKPYTENGRAVSATANQPIVFKLDN